MVPRSFNDVKFTLHAQTSRTLVKHVSFRTALPMPCSTNKESNRHLWFFSPLESVWKCNFGLPHGSFFGIKSMPMHTQLSHDIFSTSSCVAFTTSTLCASSVISPEVGFWVLRTWLMPPVKFDGYRTSLTHVAGEKNSYGSFRAAPPSAWFVCIRMALVHAALQCALHPSCKHRLRRRSDSKMCFPSPFKLNNLCGAQRTLLRTNSNDHGANVLKVCSVEANVNFITATG